MGLFDAVLDSIRRSGDPRDLRFGQSIAVVAAYGEMLAEASAAEGEVGNAHDLPYAKDAIKHALMHLMRGAADVALREPLRIGYVRLADWQYPDESAHVPIHFGHASTRGNPLALARQLANDRDPGRRLWAAARAERQALLAELRRLEPRKELP